MSKDRMSLGSPSDESHSSSDENQTKNTAHTDVPQEKPAKKYKPGIVYLSSIPYGMTIFGLKKYFSNFGEIGNVFFQMADRENFVGGLNRGTQHNKKIRKMGRLIKGRVRYSEGWVEFLSKRKAKWTAEMLNNSPVGGKKKSPYYDCLWSVKYIGKGFKWAQLRRRIEHEKEIHKRRMANEIRIVAQETDQYTKATEVAERMERKRQKQDVAAAAPCSSATVGVRQRLTEQEIKQKQQDKKMKNLKFKAKLQKSKNKKHLQKQVKREEKRQSVKSLAVM